MRRAGDVPGLAVLPEVGRASRDDGEKATLLRLPAILTPTVWEFREEL